jgi:hypothetical protein
MTMTQPVPTADQVRVVLAAAADVLFSDGVPDAFLDQWADETRYLLAVAAESTQRSVR